MQDILQLVDNPFTPMCYLLTLSRADTDACTNGHKGHSQQCYNHWDDALTAYTVAYHAGDVKVSPEPNSRFWTAPQAAFCVAT